MVHFRFLPWFIASLLCALAAGCGGQDSNAGGLASGGLTPPDSVAIPLVAAVTPRSNATGVQINTTVVIAAFNTPVDPTSLTAASFTLACPAGTAITGTVGYVPSGNVATFTPQSLLPANTTCTATITTGVKNTKGVALASAFVWTFTTGAALDVAAPSVSSTVPLANAAGVSINQIVTAIFGEPMDPLTITTGTFVLACPAGTAVTGTVGYGATGNVATFTPTSGLLPANTSCTATITTGAKDVEGVALGSAYTWTFSTAAGRSFCEQSFSQTDHFTTGSSINGQNGWSQLRGFDDQVVNVGATAQGGQNVWKLSNKVVSGSFDDQPLSPQLSESAGESTVRTAGGGDSMEAVFWMRPVSSTADGSTLTISMSPSDRVTPGRIGAERINYFRLVNNLDTSGGFQTLVIDYFDVHNTGNSRTFVTSTDMDRTAWTKVRMVMRTSDGSSNDVFQIFLNDQLVGTFSTWEDYWTWPLGGNSVTKDATRLMFRVNATASGVDPSFVNANAQGFHFDNVCYRVYNRATPDTTIQFYRTGFEP
jgi:hypothetical protein